MKDEKQAAYETREEIMKLLSDEEVTRVSATEAAAHLSDGDQYIDLENFDKGVLKAEGMNTPMGRVLSRNAVRKETWEAILAKLAAANAA